MRRTLVIGALAVGGISAYGLSMTLPKNAMQYKQTDGITFEYTEYGFGPWKRCEVKIYDPEVQDLFIDKKCDGTVDINDGELRNEENEAEFTLIDIWVQDAKEYIAEHNKGK